MQREMLLDCFSVLLGYPWTVQELGIGMLTELDLRSIPVLWGSSLRNLFIYCMWAIYTENIVM